MRTQFASITDFRQWPRQAPMSKATGAVLPVHNERSHESGGRVPLILNLGTRSRTPAALPVGKEMPAIRDREDPRPGLADVQQRKTSCPARIRTTISRLSSPYHSHFSLTLLQELRKNY